ncbi:ArsR/SmtB family transcription factor [Streptomyces tagetis]|uniref:Helix-turn-helix transcriptional regulator n=1 Tax=Streptomyces tagetis TaxID=2820809 RepID=A0A940XM41_9ACTN|nr:helix-turn-helix domain-containing protein [Streptomyces sp. RG38]MBQ0828906.1 helix-turn-helix transcriptional regulator [Streptomyces sp. RG38]
MSTRARRAPAKKALPHPDLREVPVSLVLRALGEPLRLGIVRSLAQSEHPMNCSSFGLSVSKSTSTYHFKVLRESGVISQFEEGTSRYSELRDTELEQRFPGLLTAILAATEDPAGG